MGLLAVIGILFQPSAAFGEESDTGDFASGEANGRTVTVKVDQRSQSRQRKSSPSKSDMPYQPSSGSVPQAGHSSERPAYELKMYGGQLVRVAPWRSKPALTIEGCWDGPVELMECRIIPEDEPSEGSEDAAPGKRASRGQVEHVVRSLVSRLELPVPVPSVGPDPHANEWGMAVVGYPLWLWTDNPAEVSSTVSGEGITIAIVARRGVTSFAMGDGGRVECGRMTPYSASVKPGAKSPTCGYVYGQPSLPRGAYTVSASSRWVVEWSALGFQGSLPVTVTGERELRVGELHALVVR